MGFPAGCLTCSFLHRLPGPKHTGEDSDSGLSAEDLLKQRRYRLLAMKMTELRPICKRQGIPMHGTKEVIVERLLSQV